MSFAMASTLPCAPAKLGCNTKALRATPICSTARQVRAHCAGFSSRHGDGARQQQENNHEPFASRRHWIACSVLGRTFHLLLCAQECWGRCWRNFCKRLTRNDVKASEWLKTHPPGDRNLVQGLKADATYLVVSDEGQIEKYGVNAVCTHLGCVVPWNSNEKKFKCPCHGSQYNREGKVVRGPAPLSLALAHCDVKDDLVTFSPWTETDFRTGEKPWS